MGLRRVLRAAFRSVVPLPVPPCDHETLAVMTAVLRRDSVAVDAGCNRGSILREIVRLAPEGRHLAFEPNPMLARRLRREYPGVEVHQAALSDRSGTAPFHLAAFDGLSGFERGPDTGGSEVEVVTVQTVRLDDVVSANRRIAFIKIDVQGAEYLVLRGARELLARDRPVVVFECGLGGLELYGTEPRAIVELFDAIGFTVHPLVGWPASAAVSGETFAAMFAAGTHYMWVAQGS